MSKTLLNILEQRSVTKKADRLTRQAFIYMEPSVGNSKNFAQCGQCKFFLPGKQKCSLFGKKDHIVANGSCSLFIQGQPDDDQKIENQITPEDAGYVVADVRCENCKWFDGKSQCGLFKLLNQKNPTVFNLNTRVKPKGCCNGWQD